MNRTVCLALAATLVATAAAAQQAQPDAGFFTFRNEDQNAQTYTTLGGCTGYRRPQIAEKWVQGQPGERILEAIHFRQIAANLKKAGKCTCELRFPTWDAAMAEYQTKILPLNTDDAPWIPGYVVEGGRMLNQFTNYCRSQGIK
ncbi:hypothetical protein FJU08_20855 [Martelella alba]|uniref:Uncharacterized protein n=1 Tax=Martelella alba TaxID=2590451 RepID=A0A506TYB8_9HYPH|nr:hypothetical protein [Martelella alba]TPW27062.1 hypothetical protein FJU08_20855 [Martelella alba]